MREGREGKRDMILVTGATGNIGRGVVPLLLSQGERVRVFTRDAAKVTQWGDTVEVAVGDLGAPGALSRAVEGVTATFLINFSPDVELFRRVVDEAKAHAKTRIVFLSSFLAGSPQLQMGKMHKDKEDVLRDGGFGGNFLRPGGLMSNAYQWARTIKAEGVVYNPMGDGKTAPVAAEDIAEVAARALRTSGLPEILELSGGELLSVPDQVRTLASVLGKPIRCVDIPVEAAIQNLMRGGVPAPMAAAIGESFELVRSGRAATSTDTVERWIGRRPKTFEAWAQAHASRFA
jgi:(4-alkanoyl-5-oxo-2,5-dihydrofuran-3-yl)methyl phosphate reductase